MHTSLRSRHKAALWLLPLLALILCAGFIATGWHHDDDSAAHPCAVCAVAHATWTTPEAPSLQAAPVGCEAPLVVADDTRPASPYSGPCSSRAPPA